MNGSLEIAQFDEIGAKFKAVCWNLTIADDFSIATTFEAVVLIGIIA